MKYRVLHNWSITRVIYVLMGTFLIIQAAQQKQWVGVLLGTYFAAMGIFAFGCAAGNCYNYNSNSRRASHSKEEILFEEVKSTKG